MRTAVIIATLALGGLLGGAGCYDLDLPMPTVEGDGGMDLDVDTDADGDSDCDPGWAGASCEICVRFVAAGQPDGGNGLSWMDPFNSVSAAVASAATATVGPGDVCEVWVSTSTYWIYQSSCEDTIQLPPNVHLYGGFAGTEQLREERDFVNNQTVLAGRDESDSFSVYHVIRAEGDGDVGAVIDGFWITGGIANGGGVESQGGGLLTYQDGITVDNCVFYGNQADAGGGAIANILGTPIVRRTKFIENVSSTKGGAIFNHNGDLQLENCVFWNNSATAGGGAIYNAGATSTPFGGVTVNCTFHANTSNAILGEGPGAPNIRNSIFWETGDPPIVSTDGASAEVAYCRVDGDYGTLNVDGDPDFADAASGDFHLDPASVCVDAADGEGAPETDIEGVARYDWPETTNTGVGDPDYVDIGAYELTD